MNLAFWLKLKPKPSQGQIDLAATLDVIYLVRSFAIVLYMKILNLQPRTPIFAGVCTQMVTFLSRQKIGDWPSSRGLYFTFYQLKCSRKLIQKNQRGNVRLTVSSYNIFFLKAKCQIHTIYKTHRGIFTQDYFKFCNAIIG